MSLHAAHALLAAGRYAEAEAWLAASEDAEARPLLGKLLLQRGAWAEALVQLVTPSFDRAWCLFQLERLQEAAGLLQALDPTPTGLHLLGRAWLELGEAEAALGALTESGLPAADLQAGFCHFVLGRPEAAAIAWERWLRAGAADWGTKDALAMLLFLIGGGRRPTGRPERPAEPLRDMDRWFALLARYRRLEAVDAAIARLPQLDPVLSRALQMRWAVTLVREGLPERADRLLG